MNETAILIEDAHKSFGKNEVLHGISLDVHPSEIVGLVGPSGCGKTTLVDIVVGLSLPTSGQVRIKGEQAPYRHARHALGYMPQDTALYEDITAQENISFFGTLYGLSHEEIVEASARALRLSHLDEEGRKMVATFSGGMKRRLSLAISLLCNPSVLVLDEPTVGLDPIHRNELWKTFADLSKQGAALVVTTHIMDEAARCDRVAMMRDGLLICCATPQELLEKCRCSTLEEAFIVLAENGREVRHA